MNSNVKKIIITSTSHSKTMLTSKLLFHFKYISIYKRMTIEFIRSKVVVHTRDFSTDNRFKSFGRSRFNM